MLGRNWRHIDYRVTHPDAAWRQLPATAAQRHALDSRGVAYAAAITRGDAHDQIRSWGIAQSIARAAARTEPPCPR